LIVEGGRYTQPKRKEKWITDKRHTGRNSFKRGEAALPFAIDRDGMIRFDTAAKAAGVTTIVLIAQWQEKNNTIRPHRSLGKRLHGDFLNQNTDFFPNQVAPLIEGRSVEGKPL